MDVFLVLARLTGVAAPRLRIPYPVAWLAAASMEGWARVAGGEPRVPLTAVRMARKRMYFDAGKAVRELGLPQTDPETALGDAVEWFVARGYAARPARRSVA
ncbi:MAG: NAD-dependent dehydratase, partial [Candidatus Rokuibacteriota bacterium]